MNMPPELRNRLYDFVATDIIDTFEQRNDPTVGTVQHGTSTPESRRKASDRVIESLLVSRAVQLEFFPRYCALKEWSWEAEHTLTGPRYYPQHTEREMVVFANAKIWVVVGSLQGTVATTGHDYYVKITLQSTTPGYRSLWRHLTDEGRIASGTDLAKNEYEAMVSRVERAFVAVLAEREAIDGVSGLYLDGMGRIIDAFYFDGREV